MTIPTEYTQQLLAYLQTWRQYLEQATGSVAPVQSFPPAPWPGVAAPPAIPFVPPMAPGAATPPMAIAPTDYTQQLLTYLQAWRQYLEQATRMAPGPPEPTTAPPTPPPAMRPAQERVSPADDYGSGITDESQTDLGPDTARSADEPAPNGASLYDRGRSSSPSTPAAERRTRSAYPRAADPAFSGTLPHAEPRSLYSSSSGRAAPATWWESGGSGRPAVSNDTAGSIELVPPPASQNMNR
jgi:hypothetical protein